MNFLKYSLLRLGIMVLAFLVCLYLDVGIIFSGIFAVLIAFAVSYLAFPRLHVAAGADVQGWLRRRRRPTNEAEEENRSVEDSYVDDLKRRSGEEF